MTVAQHPERYQGQIPHGSCVCLGSLQPVLAAKQYFPVRVRRILVTAPYFRGHRYDVPQR